MFDILTLLQCLVPEIKVTTMRQLSRIIMAMLAMSGRVTMLGMGASHLCNEYKYLWR
jgi:hypothetical protein